MKTPETFARARVLLALVAALGVAATAASAEPQPGAAPGANTALEATSEPPADAAEAEALAVLQAKLERNLEAELATRFDALSERLLRESVGSLAALHDARLRQRIRLSARIDQQLVRHSRTPSNEYDAFAADGAEMIVVKPIPTRALPN